MTRKSVPAFSRIRPQSTALGTRLGLGSTVFSILVIEVVEAASQSKTDQLQADVARRDARLVGQQLRNHATIVVAVLESHPRVLIQDDFDHELARLVGETLRYRHAHQADFDRA